MKPSDLVILGGSANSESIIEAVQLSAQAGAQRFESLHVLDDNLKVGSKVLGVPVSGRLSEAKNFATACFVNGIGSENSFRNLPQIVSATGIAEDRFVNIKHPSAVCSSYAELGVGVTLLANAVVCAGARIGNHVMVLQATVINHDSNVGDYCVFGSQVAVLGGVSIAENVFVGANASIKSYVNVGEQALIGIGAVVLKDVAPRSVVVGNPARPI